MLSESLQSPLKLSPQYVERPWGGNLMWERLGKHVPPTHRIGESWELSDHPSGLSRVAEGPFKGWTFGALVREHPREMIGSPKAPDRFPLLIKYLDAQEDLSVQVHPDDEWCLRHNHADRGKAECWYIMDAAPGAQVIFGLQPGVTPDEFRKALGRQDPGPLLRRLPIRTGDFVIVPPGAIHAILAGTLLCEIQQSSDTTFRLWDWNRQPPRELHIDRGLDVARFDAPLPIIQHLPENPASTGVIERGLVSNPHFRVRMLEVPQGKTGAIRLPAGTRGGWALNVVVGSGVLADRRPLRMGETWWLPAAIDAPVVVTASEHLRLLLTESLEQR